MTLALATAAPAHVVYQRRTLRQWAQQCDVIVLAEILSPLQVWSAADRSDHQEFFTIRVVDHVAGEAVPESFDIFPHAEGEPRYEVGDRALLFLDRTAARAEFAPLAERFAYFTTQGSGQEWILRDQHSEALPIALEWRERRSSNDYRTRRDLLLRELAADDRRLRNEALADFAQLRSSDDFRADLQTQQRLAAMVRAERLAVAERISMIHLLDGIPGFSSSDEMLRLAKQTTEGGQRLSIIRACGALRDDAITAWLRRQLADSDRAVRIATLNALAHPWHAAAAEDLVAIASSPDSDVRIGASAIRALGGIGNPAATTALRDIADRQQPPISSLARAELARLQAMDGRRSGTPSPVR